MRHHCIREAWQTVNDLLFLFAGVVSTSFKVHMDYTLYIMRLLSLRLDPTASRRMHTSPRLSRKPDTTTTISSCYAVNLQTIGYETGLLPFVAGSIAICVYIAEKIR